MLIGTPCPGWETRPIWAARAGLPAWASIDNAAGELLRRHWNALEPGCGRRNRPSDAKMTAIL